MRRTVLFLVLIFSTSTGHLESQVKGTSNAFVLPPRRSSARPAELTIDLSFKEPSGTGVLHPDGTGQLLIAVTNTGGTQAKDVRLKLFPASQIEGITFDRDVTIGAIDSSQRREIVLTFIAAKVLTTQKGMITVQATEAATKKIFAASFSIETSPGKQSLEALAQSAAQSAFSLQPTPPEKLSPAVLQLRAKVAADPNDALARLQLIQLLFNERLYNDVIIDGEKALAIFQDKPVLYQQVGESYRQFRRYDQALQFLERGYNLDKAPSTNLAASYGLTLLHVGKTQDGALVLRKAAQEDPNFVRKRLSNANSLFGSKDIELAADEYFAVLIVQRSLLTPEQISLVQFSIDFKTIFESHDRSEISASFVDVLRKKLGDKFDYAGLAVVFAGFIRSNQLGQASNFYADILKWNADSVSQDSLDRKFLGIAYGCLIDSADMLLAIQNAFVRRIKNVYSLDDEEVKPICVLHEFVLKQGSASAAADITTSLLGGTSLSQDRYVKLADAFVQYRRNDDAVGTFNLILKKKSLDKFMYKDDLTGIYSQLLQSQKTVEAQQLTKKVSALNGTDMNGANLAFADIFTSAGQTDKSIEILRMLVQSDPGSVVPSLRLGDVLFAKERYDDIISNFANGKTKAGKWYLALAYEKKHMLKEANQTWEEYRKLTTDPKELANAKNHEDENLIALFNPDGSNQHADVSKTNVSAGKEKFEIVIDSPAGGSLTAATSIKVTGKFIGNAMLQDVKINGKSVGTDRGMKMVDTQASPSDVSSGLPFAYVVPLAQGKNDIAVEATATNGEIARAQVTVTMNAETAAKPMTIEEADGIRQNKAYAVIIGIAKYADPAIPSLNYTVNDAQALYDVLTDPNYGGFRKDHVTILLNEKATTSAIKKAIGVDLKRAPEDGIAVVYFAGHGAPEGEETYWLTYDSKISQTLYASALSNDEISGMLKRINTNRVVTLLDCCYSGASIAASRSTRAVLVDDPFRALEGSGSITITSSDGKEQSLEDSKLKHGIFTFRLLEAIKGKADINGDGTVMADEIAKYIQETVPNDARERSHKQDPQIVTNYTGFIPISRNPENVIKNSIILQVQRFQSLYLDGKIGGPAFKKIKDIIEGNDDKSKKPVKAYFDGVFTLKDLLEIVGK
jgi:tetratricopeptide (TPR) repeat protein